MRDARNDRHDGLRSEPSAAVGGVCEGYAGTISCGRKGNHHVGKTFVDRLGIRVGFGDRGPVGCRCERLRFDVRTDLFGHPDRRSNFDHAADSVAGSRVAGNDPGLQLESAVHRCGHRADGRCGCRSGAPREHPDPPPPPSDRGLSNRHSAQAARCRLMRPGPVSGSVLASSNRSFPRAAISSWQVGAVPRPERTRRPRQARR